MKRIYAFICAIIFLLSCCSCTTGTGNFLRDSITIIVPYGAGGTTDLVARELAVSLEKELHVSVVIENQSGASGAIGAQAVLDAAADGKTLLLGADSLGGTLQIMDIADISYLSFAPILSIADDPKVIAVSADSDCNTIEDLLSAMEANPGKVQMSYTGPGGSGHVQALILNQLGYYPALTAYQSGSEGLLAVLSGQVSFTNANFSTVANYLEQGQMKLLAVCANTPLQGFEEIPTLGSVFPNHQEFFDIAYTPLTLFAHKDTPDDILQSLRDAALRATSSPDFNTWMDENHIQKLYETYQTPDEILAFYENWASLVTYLMYDAGAAVHSPEKFGIYK